MGISLLQLDFHSSCSEIRDNWLKYKLCIPGHCKDDDEGKDGLYAGMSGDENLPNSSPLNVFYGDSGDSW